MSCTSPLAERLWPLSVCIFLPLAAGCGLGSGDNNGQGAAFINSQEDRDAGEAPPDHPGDPACDAGTNPMDECSALGGLCLPIDPATGWIECPEGLYPIGAGCGDPNLPAVCCGRIEEPPPPFDCFSQGGYCAPFDPSQSGACPDGAPGFYDPSCGDPMNGGGLCCLQDIPPPPDECSAVGGICLPASDTTDPTGGVFIGCPDGLVEIGAGCADDGSGIRSVCCGRVDQPPPTDCASIGGFCGRFDEQNGFFCPDGTQPVAFDPNCGDPQTGGGVCCLPGEPPPPPSDCASLGGYCGRFDEQTGEIYCGEGDLILDDPTCADPTTGRGICCVPNVQPPQGDCGSLGGYCGGFDPQTGEVYCGANDQVLFDPLCGDPQTGGGVCCVPSGPQPPADCGSLGGYCGGFDPQTGEVYCGGNDQVLFDPTCGDPQFGGGVCCVPSEPPTPTDCGSLGGYCGGFDPQTGEVYCDVNDQIFEDPTCGDLNSGRGICCVPGGQPPPPPVDACSEIGGFCAPLDENFGAECPPGTVAHQEILCGDENQGIFGLCCVRDEQPPTNNCPDPNAGNVFYVSQDPALCAAISYTCPSNHVVFESDCGCGCIGY